MSRRWRPGLGLVLGGALAGTLVLALAGMVALRYLGPVIGFRNAAALLAVVIAAATACLGWLLLRLLLRPIRALERYATAQQQAAAPVPPRHFGTQELYTTAQRVIAMAGALRDREASIRAYSNHVTHELRSPVAVIRAASELLRDGKGLSPGDLDLLDQIDGAGAQIDDQLAALRHVARARETRYLGQCRAGDLLAALRDAHLGLEITLNGQNLTLPIAAEGVRIVLDHLLANAVQHGATRLRLSTCLTPEGTCLRVSDNGAGIAPGAAERIFQPFFTTRREAGGTGMGLAVARAIMQAHRGDLVQEPSTTGASFCLRFATADLAR